MFRSVRVNNKKRDIDIVHGPISTTNSHGDAPVARDVNQYCFRTVRACRWTNTQLEVMILDSRPLG